MWSAKGLFERGFHIIKTEFTSVTSYSKKRLYMVSEMPATEAFACRGEGGMPVCDTGQRMAAPPMRGIPREPSVLAARDPPHPGLRIPWKTKDN